ncbi:lipid A export permease/ATP-binding protein MsbA [Vandammella animalimorsus]|uniref:Lipid A export permease/ATP-binding protein MsbA n=1 Tax=Vandammella animalimorsus TaxID=2029117 RepID=A0A2A2A932_9BURK|nr:lipid A export permease/ATP-binding protein MsbA [Vandammella animalimorsus]PAT34282.1 lipid A export permease/ATP-binding protein MsbA [Vandammella animalimorsus]
MRSSPSAAPPPAAPDSSTATADAALPPLWQRLKRLTPYFAKHRWAWALAVLASAVAAITEPLMAQEMGRILDKGFTESSLALWWIPLVMVGIFLMRGMAQFIGQYSLARITNNGMFRIRTLLFECIMRADMGLYREHSASKLANTIVYETQLGAQQLVQALLGVSRDGFTLLALVGFLLYRNWQLTCIVFVMVPAIAWVMKQLSRRLYKVTKLSQQATDELAYVVEENALAYRMVRLHGAQQQQNQRFAGLSRRLEGLAVKSTIASAAMTPTTQILAAISLSIVICIALWQNRSGQVNWTVGDFTAFATAMLLLVAPMRRLTDVANPLTRGVAALERGLSLLDQAQQEHSGQHRAGRARGELVLQEVAVQFPAQALPALDGVSLHIPAGQVVALVGPSGAGKTTLVNLLPRFIEPTAGRILLDGHALPDWHLEDLRRQFAVVSQDVVMLHVSLAENVALGSQPDPARVQACLEAANLGDFVASLPQGIDTIVGHNASQLSGGQRQRLAIARALYKDAPVLILDEATSALDTQSERLVQQALQRLMQGRTTLVIAHRLATIEHADRIVVMEQGRIVEQGSHGQLLAAGGLYARLHAQPGQQGDAAAEPLTGAA